jgi:DNA polymerase III subunit epsilon
LVAAHHPSGDHGQYRDVVVFTGTLSKRRDKVAAAVSAAGWEVATSVSHRTTILVLGVQDMKKLAGSDKSTKQREAESLIAGGQKISIVDEAEFWRLLDPANG